MAKGDQNRTQNKVDEQQKMAQGYLTGVQQGLGNQAGNLSTSYFGAGAPSYGSTFGYGSTVPHYSWTNESYYPGGKSGSQTGAYTPTYNQNIRQSGTARPRNDSGGFAIPRSGTSGGLMQLLQSTGGAASPQALASLEPQLNQMGYSLQRNSAGEIRGRLYDPSGNAIDVVNPNGWGGGWAEINRGNGPGTGGSAWNQQSFAQTFGSPSTPQELIAMEPQLAQAGIRVLRNAEGTAGKIQLPDGRIVDVIQAAGAGGTGFQWLDDGGMGGGFGGGIMGQSLGDYSKIMGLYGNFAETGGLTPEQLQDIRSRSNAPVRSAYSNAQREMERGRSLQGGYSPGFNAATARMAREQGQLASDQSTNTEAMIAELQRSGKLAGMGGMASMYGATPGLANTFGNQMLQSQAQQLQAAGLQNQLSLGLISGQLGQSQVPGNWAQGIQNFSNLGKGIGEWSGAIYPWATMGMGGA
jgi:hypothetical protein